MFTFNDYLPVKAKKNKLYLRDVKNYYSNKAI